MRKNKKALACLGACLALVVLLAPTGGAGFPSQAAEVIATVEGKVLPGTTAGLLFLGTSEGRMEIKIDGETDTAGCKLLLPQKTVNVSLAHGTDGYLHAVAISEEGQDPTITVDTSKISTVVGTVDDKTTDSVLYLDMAQGEMELKLDKTTDFSGCKVLVAGGRYSVSCARGSDAVMHALSVSDVQAGSAGGGAQTQALQAPAPVTNVTGASYSIVGTVKEGTEEASLLLSTGEGEKTIRIDESTDTARGMILTPGNKLMAVYFQGSDGALHATSIAGVKDSSLAKVDSASTATVTGTVNKKSTENILILDTAAGEMQLKLDKMERLSGCKALVQGKRISVTCARGDDAFMHALTITAAR